MFRPKTNCSQAYVFTMLTLPKGIAVTLGRSAKGHHDLVELAQFFLILCFSEGKTVPQSYWKDALATILQFFQDRTSESRELCRDYEILWALEVTG